jgi:hypothetical protein
MMSRNSVRMVTSCAAVFAMAVQLGACSRAGNSQNVANIAEAHVSAESSQPEPPGMLPATPPATENDVAAPEPAGAAPMKPMNDDAEEPTTPRPAKPLFDLHKGFQTLEPPRRLEA